VLIPPFDSSSPKRNGKFCWHGMCKNGSRGLEMSSCNLVVESESISQEWIERAPLGQGAHVTVVRSVNADRNRVFQALSLGEYIDAWFVAPGSVPGSTSVSMKPDCFLICYDLLNGGQERFVGSYKVLRRSKVQFSWKRDSLQETSPSLVKIRLQGDFERTTVHLTHVGLSESELSWYRLLWERSLERLAGLF
jgi:uncharacterized protein YndB with AHSA1/START domain